MCFGGNGKKKRKKMGFSELILRFFAGGSAIVIISWLARSRYPFIAGIFLLFPVVTMLGFFFLGQSESPEKIRTITLFTIYSLPAVVTFLVAFYFLQNTAGVLNALIYAIGAWFMAAILLVIFNELFVGIGQ